MTGSERRTSERITDDKVEKALKCCEGEYSTNCKECYYSKFSIADCRCKMHKDALDLINYLQEKKQQLICERYW